MAFQEGPFNQEQTGLFRPFTPSLAIRRIEHVNLENLWAQGKRLILLDVDNTLVPWRTHDFAPEVLDWLARAKAQGFNLCILSNTRNVERLTKLSQQLDIPFLRDKFKPSRRMYQFALEKYQAKPSEAIMVGDQILTDIWGANRTGIDSIFLERLSNKEFIGTRFNRQIERAILKFVYRHFPDTGTPKEASSLPSQFFRFAVVGATSFTIDAGVLYILSFGIKVGGQPLGQVLGEYLTSHYPNIFGSFATPSKAATPLLQIPATSLAILNSFYWNRRWTFEIEEAENTGVQFRKFLALSLTGMLINNLITSGLNNIIPGHEKRSLLVAKIVATFVVAFWNFFGQRIWAFRKK